MRRFDMDYISATEVRNCECGNLKLLTISNLTAIEKTSIEYKQTILLMNLLV